MGVMLCYLAFIVDAGLLHAPFIFWGGWWAILKSDFSWRLHELDLCAGGGHKDDVAPRQQVSPLAI